MYNFIIFSLAVYALSHILAYESGPFGVLDKLRKRFPKSALTCAICTSVWVATVLFVVIAVGYGLYLAPLSAVGIVILLEKL